MGDENLFEFLHFELVNYCVNEKKVSCACWHRSISLIINFRTMNLVKSIQRSRLSSTLAFRLATESSSD